jgi:hypothetical protein
VPGVRTGEEGARKDPLAGGRGDLLAGADLEAGGTGREDDPLPFRHPGPPGGHARSPEGLPSEVHQPRHLEEGRGCPPGSVRGGALRAPVPVRPGAAPARTRRGPRRGAQGRQRKWPRTAENDAKCGPNCAGCAAGYGMG